MEYGAIENTKGSPANANWELNKLKLATVLHDQIRALEVTGFCDETALKRFRCAGFVTAGEQEFPESEDLKHSEC